MAVYTLEILPKMPPENNCQCYIDLGHSKSIANTVQCPYYNPGRDFRKACNCYVQRDYYEEDRW